MKITVPQIKQKKKSSEKIIALTAYDASFAKCLDQTGVVDILLIGDSLGMVIQGQKNTLSVTVDQMIYHTQSVSRATQRAHVVADMPFLSYQVSHDKGIENAGRLLKEGGAESVKLEGGEEMAPLVKKLTRIGIPVMGHLGLTPQSIHQFGGYKIQGRGEAGEQLIKDALALEEAGAYGIVLESIPAPLAQDVTQRLSIPTIGIGAGASCDGQVLVIYDLLGLDPSFKPKFVKQYANLHAIVTESVRQFATEVQQGKFPESAHFWKS